MMTAWRKRLWAWCTNSEIVLWSRIQVLFGSSFGVALIVWSVASGTDVSALLSPKWVAVWAIANGVIGELLRRNGTITRDGHLIATATLDPSDPQSTKLQEGQ